MQNKLLFFRAMVLTIAVAPFGCVSAEPEKPLDQAPPLAATEATPVDGAKETTPPESASPDDPSLPPALSASKELKRELENLRFEKMLIDARLALLDAKRKEEEGTLTAEKAKLDSERALQAARRASEYAALDEEKAKLEREMALENAKATQALTAKLNQARQLETDAKIFKMELDNTVAQYTANLAKYQREREASKVAVAEPKLLKEPLVDGTLYISDRRVELNGAVTQQMADDIITRLNFLNNQSAEYPIFIVIDNSPGGSVAAGFQILKAMESSKAPVYVVVKGFAASMAAVITTLAERSYAYNNTIMLHHQMLTSFQGNMSVLKEQLEWAQVWYERLATPVAKKMGLSLEAFTKEMYAHTVTGDWREFGENAQKLKWVDNIVDRIVETGIRDMLPDRPPQVGVGPRTASALADCVEKVDEQGRPYIQLPVLENPYDVWWLYDKRGLYRAQ